MFYTATLQLFFLLHSDLVKFICFILNKFLYMKEDFFFRVLSTIPFSPFLKLQPARNKCKFSHSLKELCHSLREELCFVSNTESWWELGVAGFGFFACGFGLGFKKYFSKIQTFSNGENPFAYIFRVLQHTTVIRNRPFWSWVVSDK